MLLVPDPDVPVGAGPPGVTPVAATEVEGTWLDTGEVVWVTVTVVVG